MDKWDTETAKEYPRQRLMEKTNPRSRPQLTETYESDQFGLAWIG